MKHALKSRACEQMSGLIFPGDIVLKVNGKAVSGLDNPEEVSVFIDAAFV